MITRYLALAALALAAGCANEVDDSENDLLPVTAIDRGITEPAPDGGAGGDGGPGVGGGCPATGDVFIFDSLRVTSLAGNPQHGAIAQLNNVWARDIELKELNVLFEVVAADEAGVRVRAVNAARLDDDREGRCVLPHTAIDLDFARDGDRLVMRQPAGVNIYAGSQSIPRNCAPAAEVRHTIPVRDAILEARPSADCGALLDGRAVQAVLYADDLRGICTCLAPGQPAEQCRPLDPGYTSNPDPNGNDCNGCNSVRRNLETLLIALGGGAAGYEPGPGGRDVVRLQATFSAARLQRIPPACD